jgi:NitT/TauT family transport system ATP-binding protein
LPSPVAASLYLPAIAERRRSADEEITESAARKSKDNRRRCAGADFVVGFVTPRRMSILSQARELMSRPLQADKPMRRDAVAAEPRPPTQERVPVIDIRDVSLTFETADGKVEALAKVDLQVAAGDFVSFIGPSGCGKTTLLRLIAELERPTSGRLLVNGLSPEEARRQRRYGFIFQSPALYPWRTVERNVMLPLEVMGFSLAGRRQRARRYLELVELSGFARKFPWQLSGGMQQRVSIARALSFDPELLLMDEPFGALDEIVRDYLNEQLLRLWDKTGKTVLFVTHSIPEAVFLSTRIVVMSPRPGRIADIITSDLPRDRPLDIRETPEFMRIAHRVRIGLRSGHSYE